MSPNASPLRECLQEERNVTAHEQLLAKRESEAREIEYKAQANRAAEAKRKQRADRERAEQSTFAAYSAKPKSVIEQTLNYSTCGTLEGTNGCFWAASPTNKCVATSNSGKTVDIRTFNQTGFRIRTETTRQSSTILTPIAGIYISYWYGEHLDAGFLRGNEPSLDRLQKAWGLTFAECPGRKSAF